MSEPLLSFDRVVRVFATGPVNLLGRVRGVRRAVDEVCLAVYPGETYALVGESGCGKSTLARMAVALLRPTEGRVLFEGADVGRMRGRRLRGFRRRVQMVFQDPAGALDPRQRVASAVEEPLLVHGIGTPAERRLETARLLEVVGLSEREGSRFPHQLSGGQKQRVLIARALALSPSLILLDEPVSALDVSVRAQILNLLTRIQRGSDLAYLFISHDIGVVRYMADRVGVMHQGRLVEEGAGASVFESSAHPYTRALLESVPLPDPAARPSPPLVPPTDPPGPGSGRTERRQACLYAPACPQAAGLCFRRRPRIEELRDSPGHGVACHFPG